MSVNVTKEWYYFLRGREILLYKLLGGSSTERVTQSGVFSTRSHELMYPDEDIANGLRVEYTALNEPFVAESLETTTSKVSGITIAFVDGGVGSDTITDSASGFNFSDGDKIRVQGSANNDGDYTLNGTANTGTLTVATGTFTAETAGERIVITQIPKEVTSPDETSHINLNKMLSLAVIDYIKAMKADRNGELDKKEYYMKEFYSKLGDNESNIRKISMSFPSSPFAVR
tara:strand:- start:1039 stop:1728 length:690 start_codon:yes stop_codon:yes gene_type:complete